MDCTFCHKIDRSLSTHKLCNCCITYIKSCNGTDQIAESDCFPGKVKQEAELIINDDDEALPNAEDGKIACGICFERVSNCSLQQHQKVSCPYQMVFKCSACGELYVSREGLLNHLDRHKIAEEQKEHSSKEIRVSQKLRSCVLCNNNRGYPERLFWEHVHEDHDGHYLLCFVCGKSFRSQKLKAAHDLQPCNSSNLKEYVIQNKNETNLPGLTEQCPHCSEKFPNVIRLRRHVVTKHKNLLRGASISGLRLRRPMIFSNLTCPKCKSKFHSRAVLRRHQKMNCKIGNYRCKICDMGYQLQSALYLHMKRDHGQDPTVDEIEKAVNHSPTTNEQIVQGTNSLTITVSQETSVKVETRIQKPAECVEDDAELPDNAESSGLTNKFRCRHCPKIYGDKLQLLNHIDRCHRSTACEICGEMIAGYNRMRYHKLKQHSIEKHSCPQCPAKFLIKSDLRRHMTIHTRSAKHHCELCGKWMVSESRLVQHLQRRHPKEAAEKLKSIETIFPCPECPRTFKEEYRLNSHQYMHHRPMTCDICGITVLGINRKTYHKAKFHPEDRHHCPHCPKKFHLKYDYVRHVKITHIDGKIPCKLCSSKLKNRSTLAKHMKRKHPDEYSGMEPDDPDPLALDEGFEYTEVKNETPEDGDEEQDDGEEFKYSEVKNDMDFDDDEEEK